MYSPHSIAANLPMHSPKFQVAHYIQQYLFLDELLIHRHNNIARQSRKKNHRCDCTHGCMWSWLLTKNHTTCGRASIQQDSALNTRC